MKVKLEESGYVNKEEENWIDYRRWAMEARQERQRTRRCMPWINGCESKDMNWVESETKATALRREC